MSEAAAPPSTHRSAARPLANDVLLTCGLAWAASLIHVQAAIDHFDEYWLYAIFFIALALAQFAWAIALRRSPRSGLLVTGAIVSVAVVALWLLSRTVGLPLGPDLHGPEPAGLLDVIATADEIAIAGLITLQLHAPAEPGGLRGGRAASLRGAALLLIILSSLLLAGGAHAH